MRFLLLALALLLVTTGCHEACEVHTTPHNYCVEDRFEDEWSCHDYAQGDRRDDGIYAGSGFYYSGSCASHGFEWDCADVTDSAHSEDDRIWKTSEKKCRVPLY